MCSLAVMVYLAARKIPRLDDTLESFSSEGGGGFFGKIGYFFDSLPWGRLDFLVSQFLEKILRRVRIFVMRVDNRLIHHLGKIKSLKDSHLQLKEKRMALFDGNKESGESENNTSDVIEQ